jgi:acetate kinase
LRGGEREFQATQHNLFRRRAQARDDSAMTIIVTINSGSTSVKLSAFEITGGADAAEPLKEIAREKRSGADLEPQAVLRNFLATHDISSIRAIAHRVVHGGARFSHPVEIDGDVLSAIESLSELAPLHNPPALKWIEGAREVCGDRVPHVAAFDTAFFAEMPRLAKEYALPPSLGIEQNVRRYGFHGLAHEAMWRRWSELRPGSATNGRVISLQLGGGCSMAAIMGGRPIDTSMGFSPLEGLMMSTRTGDVDPAVVAYLAKKLQSSSEDIIERFNREAGLLGVSGLSQDLNDLIQSDSPDARFAVDLYCYRARKTLGAYLAVLGGCDAILFGGGVGEHIPQVRSAILEGLAWTGIDIDPARNERATGSEANISSAQSKISVHVIPVDEERVLARAALSLMSD